MTFDPTRLTYGADMSGLVCGFHFRPGAPGRAIDAESAIAWLAKARVPTMEEREERDDAAYAEDANNASAAQSGIRAWHDADGGDIVSTELISRRAEADAREEDCSGDRGGARDGAEEEDEPDFIWLHFHLAHAATRPWMETHLDLPEVFFESLQEGSHSTRIEQQDGALLAVMNDVMFDFDKRPAEVATLWVYTHRRLMITARSKPLRSVDRLRASVRAGEAFRAPAELLVHLLRDQADLMVQIVRQASVDVDKIEDQFLSHRPRKFRHDLGGLRRVLVRLQRTLAPEPGSLFRLLARPPSWLRAHDVQDLRESTEEFSLVLGDLAGLVERIRLLQEEIASRLDEESNRTLFTLTMVTVLALPINIIAGFFGMNVGGVPLAQNQNGFWLLVFIVASFTALAGWWAFRRRDEK